MFLRLKHIGVCHEVWEKNPFGGKTICYPMVLLSDRSPEYLLPFSVTVRLRKGALKGSVILKLKIQMNWSHPHHDPSGTDCRETARGGKCWGSILIGSPQSQTGRLWLWRVDAVEWWTRCRRVRPWSPNEGGVSAPERWQERRKERRSRLGVGGCFGYEEKGWTRL